MTAAISALAPWFGSKRTIAPKIVEALGEHRAYFEPFCGSMAVLLGKPRATFEQVNDLHGDLINLARVTQDPRQGPKLYRQLRRVLFAQELWRETADYFRDPNLLDVAEPDLARAARFAIFSWFGRNGSIGTRAGNNFCVRYTSNGGSPATRWGSFVKSIPWFHKRLQGVTITREDGFAMLERIEDKAGTVIYVDPPYLQKGAEYVHDFEQEVAIDEALADGEGEKPGKRNDHVRLAARLWRYRQTRVVLSYYEHPALERLYPGWEKIAAKAPKAMVYSGGRQKGTVLAPEVLLITPR